MNIADYIVQKLKEEGIEKVFGLSGSGTAVQMLDALGRTEGIDYVCTLHEQSAGMAADAYAAIRGGLGACVTTCGPGATNLYTAVAGSYYNSTPVIYIVGQPQLGQHKYCTELRHYGYHELDVVDVFSAVTKYVTEIKNPDNVRYEIEKAIFMAKEGRPGPVVVAIPDDVTWLEIHPETLEEFIPSNHITKEDYVDEIVLDIINGLKQSKRPILLLGKGVKCASAEKEAIELVNKVHSPVALTWGAKDLLPFEDKYNVGSFGIQGTRAGNFAIQNSDFVLAIGVRFDASEIGFPANHFAYDARLISVDIDEAELDKYDNYSIHCDMKIHTDAKIFINRLLEKLGTGISNNHFAEWVERVNLWKAKYSVFEQSYWNEEDVNPYTFIETLSKVTNGGNEVIVTDTSTSRNYMFQAFEKSGTQRLHTWTNFACLGYGLPAAIGAAYATDSMVISIMGDGALQFNIQELATVMFNRLNVKIFIFDNGGFSNIIRLQNRNLDGRHFGSDRENGLPLPDSAKIAKAYGLPVFEIKTNDELNDKITKVLEVDGPAFCSVYLDINWWTMPFRNGKDLLEDMTPKLSREEFEEVMSISQK